jgi:hypothetical protein
MVNLQGTSKKDIMDKRFADIIILIKQSHNNAIKTVNAELINLYWNIGEHISKKVELSEWGQSVVKELSLYPDK